MLEQGNYDILEFGIPQNGMNQNISPDSLPFSFAYLLENIIPKPLGEGHVRYGTRNVVKLPSPEAVILKAFPFLKSDGNQQILLYAQEFVADNANTFQVLGNRRLSFISPNNAARYVVDTSLKIEYTFNGLAILFDTIEEVTVAGTTVTITIANNAFPQPLDQVQITRVSFSSGNLYNYDLSTKTLSAALRQNLSVACIPRSATFLNTLILCNGIDPLLSWNGTHLSEVTDFVKEDTAALIRIDARHFSFTIPASFNIVDYTVGNLLQIRVMGVTTQTAIAAVNLTAQTLTVTTTTDLPNFIQNQTQILYQAWPPRFSFLYVAHDRLWALGEGASSLNFRPSQEALKVYYTYKTNTVTGWFNERSKTVPSIDLSNKHGEPDNLEAICLVGDLMAFVGRNKTQVYQGQNPLPANEGGDFQFNSILATGVIHGDLLVEFPNDVFFVNSYGIQSFSTLNVAKQFAATPLNALDPLVQSQVSTLMSSNVEYRKAVSFKYDLGSLMGFKLGTHPTLVSLFSTSPYSWTLFSGDFQKACGFLPFGNALYLNYANAIVSYADGKDGSPPLYGDQNGTAIIPFSWTLPVISPEGRRFAGRRYEIQLDYPSSFTIRANNQLNISVRGDLPKSYQQTSSYRFDLRGDLLNTVPLTTDNLVSKESLGFRFEQPYSILKDRFKFMASRFWLILSGTTQDGPLILRKIKLYGILERK